MTKKQLKDKAERKRLRDDDKLKEYAAKIVLDKISNYPGICYAGNIRLEE